jgi:hypothetical protein
MIPRISAESQKDIFGSTAPSSIKSQISLPGSIGFQDFTGIPRVWYPNSLSRRAKSAKSLVDLDANNTYF